MPAYHTTGRSAALHSETYGSRRSAPSPWRPAASTASRPRALPTIRAAPRGAIIAGRAEQQAAMQKNAADFARLVPSVRWLEPAEVLRRQPLLKPEARGGRRDLRAGG